MTGPHIRGSASMIGLEKSAIADLSQAAPNLRFQPGALASPPDWLEIFPEAKQMAVITSKRVGEGFARGALEALRRGPIPLTVLWVPDGENAKTLQVAHHCYEQLLATRLGRADVIVSLGGGSVSDLAGFVASTWHRGTDVVHLPTTLLAQVDACIGGKTAVNVGSARNVVGSFHDPKLVVIDTQVLSTLSQRDFASGMAEVVKCGYIADPRILTWIQDTALQDKWITTTEFKQCIHASLTVKAFLVNADREDRAQRMLLNYGHTIGQAIESASGLQVYRHGEAVALGMIVAARVAELLNLGQPNLTESMKQILAALGLPREIHGLTYADIEPRIALDKKTVGRNSAFILVKEPGIAEIVCLPDADILKEAFAELLPQGGKRGA
ncbi:3-dehydroquinate synthase [Lentzea sp. NPDC004789]